MSRSALSYFHVEPAVGRRLEPVGDAVLQLRVVVERIGAANELDRVRLGLDALRRPRHHPANALEPGRVDVGTDVHDDEPLEPVSKGARVRERHAPAHRQAEEREPPEAEAIHDHREVVGHGRHAVVAVGRDVAISVAALVERDDVPPRDEPGGEAVPGPGVAGDAVEEHEGRSAGIAPFDVVEIDAVDVDRSVEKAHACRKCSGPDTPGQARATCKTHDWTIESASAARASSRGSAKKSSRSGSSAR